MSQKTSIDLKSLFEGQSDESYNDSVQINPTEDYFLTTTKFSPKYDVSDQYQEFSDGYYLKLTEVLIIAGIILFWLMAIRKFTKNFDKIRTTHYREIPYKYKLKDVENLSAVNVTPNSKDGVIFTRDPINNMIRNSKLSYPYAIISNIPTTNNSVSSFKAHTMSNTSNETAAIGGSRKFTQRHKFANHKSKNLNESSFDSRESYLVNPRRKISNSLVNLSNKRQVSLRRDDSILNDNIYRSNQDKVRIQNRLNQTSVVSPVLANTNEFHSRSCRQKVMKKQQSIDNHPLNISPLIRRSFLDLHKQAIENSTRRKKENKKESVKSDSPSVSQET